MKIKEKWTLNYHSIERGEASCETGSEREDYLLTVKIKGSLVDFYIGLYM